MACSSDHFRNQLPYANRIFPPMQFPPRLNLFIKAGQERPGNFQRFQIPNMKNYYKAMLIKTDF